jgi:hypothetical protein
MIPTFEKTERKMLSEWKITADVYKGYVANRGKGTLMIRNSGAKKKMISVVQTAPLLFGLYYEPVIKENKSEGDY